MLEEQTTSRHFFFFSIIGVVETFFYSPAKTKGESVTTSLF